MQVAFLLFSQLTRIVAKLASVVLVLSLNSACTSTAGSESGSPEEAVRQLELLFEDYHNYCMRNYPTWATYEGDHRFDDRITDMRPEAFAARNDSARAFLKVALSIDTAGLSADDLLNRSLFIREMEDGLESAAFHGEYQPFSQQNGPHIDFPQIVEVQPLSSPSDYPAYLKRLKAFPAQLDQCIQLARLGIASGQVPPRFMMEQVSRQCQTMADYTMETSPFSRPLREMEEELGQAYDSLHHQLLTVIEEQISPAYGRLASFIEQEYLPACREIPGVSALPDGAARYAYSVKHHTTLGISPDEVFAIGEQEVATPKAQMEALVQEIGFEGDLPAFVAKLRSDPQFYYTDKEEMMVEYRAILDKVDQALPTLFGRLPKAPYALKEIEEYRAANAPQAYYYSAPDDGSRPGYFYVNTSNLSARPKYTMTSLALHEAVPGHHLQIAIAQELEGLPWFRRGISSTAFVEGWGLYAESLGYEMGLYEDPYQHFGALTFGMWRACRLVVDVGLHYKGWTREQAVQYMMANTPNSEADIRSEVDRYIAWPGQALAYKIGERKILELRKEATESLGASFNLQNFHDQLLEEGPLPLPLLEHRIRAWIKGQQQLDS